MIANLLRTFSRIIVGATFVFSGFVKAVDPVGGAVKFHDYFQAFSMEWLFSLSMPLAILLAVFEFVLGIFLIVNVFPRKTSITAFIFMVFFTILTLILAIFNPVTDCGCFGDAVKLTNWQTFWKNVVILAFASILFFWRKKLQSPFDSVRQLVYAVIFVGYISGIAFYSLAHLPLIDFRPYSVGSHLPSGMTIPEDAPQPEYKTTFILEKDGKQQEFTEEEYPYDDTTWVFVDSKTEVLSKGYEPPIHDFVLQHPDEGNFTDRLMEMQKPLFLTVTPDIRKIKETTAKKLQELNHTALENDYAFYIVTSSGIDIAEDFNEKNNTNFVFLQGDETNLKTIIRSNPGMLLLINGTVAGKWHYNDLPPAKNIEKPLSMALLQQQKTSTAMLIFGHALMLVVMTMLISKIRITINN